MAVRDRLPHSTAAPALLLLLILITQLAASHCQVNTKFDYQLYVEGSSLLSIGIERRYASVSVSVFTFSFSVSVPASTYISLLLSLNTPPLL